MPYTWERFRRRSRTWRAHTRWSCSLGWTPGRRRGDSRPLRAGFDAICEIFARAVLTSFDSRKESWNRIPCYGDMPSPWVAVSSLIITRLVHVPTADKRIGASSKLAVEARTSEVGVRNPDGRPQSRGRGLSKAHAHHVSQQHVMDRPPQEPRGAPRFRFHATERRVLED